MPKEREKLALTGALVARIERTEPDPGPEPSTSDHTDAEYLAMAEELLAAAPAGPFWLFAYGSLIWNPELDTILEQQPAVARGWHRSFCLKLTRWRGTREVPALMLALDRGGSCTGIAYRLPDEDRLGQIEKLLRREIDANPPTNVARWIPVRIGGQPAIALAFVAERAGPAYDGGRSHAEVAAILARAAGHWGSAAAYLQRTVSKLDEHGIRDRNLWSIQRQVAEEIERLTPSGRRA
jgi:cation transport protein ChaC